MHLALCTIFKYSFGFAFVQGTSRFAIYKLNFFYFPLVFKCFLYTIFGFFMPFAAGLGSLREQFPFEFLAYFHLLFVITNTSCCCRSVECVVCAR